MKKLLLIVSILSSITGFSQQAAEKPEILYGVIEKEKLKTAPFDKWYTANYDGYQPDTTAIRSIKKINTKNITVQIFLGTWCGDSKREVPRFMKVLNDAGFPMQKVDVIGVGGSDSLYKQSPAHEEASKGIFRVPVFIVYRDGKEINRINEYPALSLEKDFLAILSDKPYIPNYRSFEMMKKWMADSTLSDKNISARSLAWQLKPLLANEYELNSLGYLMIRQGKNQLALKIFQVNAVLYPESANVISSLGEGYYVNGDSKNAVQVLERSLELNKDPQTLKEILKILYKAKGVKPEETRVASGG